MNLYSFEYAGFYPVGAGGVILADTIEKARTLAATAITNHGHADVIDLEIKLLAKLTGERSQAWILQDGNY